jgi:hypothetical protein
VNDFGGSGICLDCGRSHQPNTRRNAIRLSALSGVEPRDIMDEWPCWYPRTNAGERMLYRDIEAIKRHRDTLTWGSRAD